MVKGQALFLAVLQLLLVLSFVSVTASADQNVSGTISTSATWTLANSPYTVTSTVSVLSGATLTIEPGVIVRFNAGTTLQVGSSTTSFGTLNALGTAENPILFTAANGAVGGWNYIRFLTGDNQLNIVRNSTIEKGTYGIRAENWGTNLLLDNVTIQDVTTSGLYMTGDSNPTVKNLNVNRAATYGIQDTGTGTVNVRDAVVTGTTGTAIYAPTSNLALTNVTISNPGRQIVGTFTQDFSDVNVGGVAPPRFFVEAQTISASTTVRDLGNPYQVTGTVTTNNGATLTIEPGVRLEFDPSSTLQISDGTTSGTLNAQGTEAKPILFTATTGAVGGWNYLRFISADNGLSVLRNLTAERGAYGIRAENWGTNLLLDNVTIQDVSTVGLYLTGDSNPTVKNLQIHRTGTYGVQDTSTTGTLTLADTAFTGNTGIAVYAPSSNLAITNVEIDNGGKQIVGRFIQDFQNVNIGGSPATRFYVDANTINTATTIRDLELPYQVSGTVVVANSATLTIQPGVHLEFDPAATLQISDGSSAGTLNAEGTQDTPILLTASDGVVGSWNYLRFISVDNQLSIIRNTTVERGTYGIRAESWGTNLLLDNVTIQDVTTVGLYMTGDSNPTVKNLHIHQAGTYGVHDTSSTGTLSLVGTTISGTTGIGVYAPLSNLALTRVSVESAGKQIVGRFVQDFADVQIGGADPERFFVDAQTVSTATTVRDLGLPYEISGTITVQNSATLTVEPGVRLEFDPGALLQISDGSSAGTLRAEGTQAKPIVLTAYDGVVGSWNYLRFISVDNQLSIIRNTTVERGTYGIRAESWGTNLLLDNVTIQDITTAGLYMTGDSNPTVKNLQINNAATYGVQDTSNSGTLALEDTVITGLAGTAVYAPGSNLALTNVDIEGNGVQIVGKFDQTFSNVRVGGQPAAIKHVPGGTLGSSTTIPESTLPYRLQTELNVPGPHTLTIEPGVELQFNAGDYLQFLTSGTSKPRLIAQGTQSQPILFTGSAGTAGSWSGLIFSPTATTTESILRNATIVDSTNSITLNGWTPRLILDNVTIDGATVRAIDMFTNSKLEGEHVIIQDAPLAIKCQTTSQLTLRNSWIGSGAAGIELANCPSSTLTNNTFTDNPTYAVSASTATVDAEDNYWGDPSGPSGAGPGVGDPAVGTVDYDPWLSAAGPFLPLVDLQASSGPGLGNISLSWDASPGSISNYAIYRARYRIGPFVNIANVTAPTTSYTDSGLFDDASFFYHVTARNSTGAEGPATRTDAAVPLTTTVSGTITTSTTWTLANSPYQVTGSVIVRNGATLTIEPGVLVGFKPGTYLRLGEATNSYGTLRAEGTQSQPIRFTAVNGAVGGWNYIQFNTYDNQLSVIRNATIEKGTYGVRAENWGTNLLLDNITIQDVTTTALYLTGDSNPTVKNLQINKASQYGVYDSGTGILTLRDVTILGARGTAIYAPTSDLALTNVDIQAGGKQIIGTFVQDFANVEIAGTAPTRFYVTTHDVSTSQTIRNLGLPYVVGGTVNVKSGAVLTIEPGVQLDFVGGTRLQIGTTFSCGSSSCPSYGTLRAEGTSADPILFTAANGVVGGWSYLYFYNSDNQPSLIRNATIEKGTYGIRAASWGTNLVLDNATIQDVTTTALYLTGDTNPTIKNLAINRAKQYGVHDTDTGTLTLDGVTFTGTTGTAIYAPSSRLELANVNIANGGKQIIGNFEQNFANVQIGGSSPPRFYVVAHTIATPTTIANVGLPYQVGGTITVNGGAVLTIPPGVRLDFQPGTTLQIGSTYSCGSSTCPNYGTLKAEGTQSEPILFTSATGVVGGWNYLYFYNSDNQLNVLRNATVERGTYGIRATSWGTNLLLDNVTLQDVTQRGLYLTGDSDPTVKNLHVNRAAQYGVYGSAAGTLTLRDTTITGNTGTAIYAPLSRLQLTNVDIANAGTQIVGNFIQDFDNVEVGGIPPARFHVAAHTVAMPTTVRQLGLPYQVAGTVTVNGGGVLTVEPGVRLDFQPGTTLQIGSTYSCGSSTCPNYGTMNAEGTQAAPILFTSASGAVGGWNYVLFSTADSQLNRLRNLTIEKGSYGVYATSWGTNLLLDNVTIQDVTTRGVYLTGDSNPTLKNLNINRAAQYGIYDSGTGWLTIDGATITGTTGTAIYAPLSSLQLTNVDISNAGTQIVGSFVQDFDNVKVGGIAPARFHVSSHGISTLTTVRQLGLPYQVAGTVTVSGGGVLTVEPGVRLEFQAGTTLQLGSCGTPCTSYGTLHAEGTQAAPILFTSASGTVGGWNYVLFSSADNQLNRLRNLTIEKGSYGVYATSWGTNLLLDNVTIQDVTARGLYLTGDSNPTLKNLKINRAAQYGIYDSGTGWLTIGGATITGTTGTAIYAPSSGLDLSDVSIQNGGTQILGNLTQKFQNVSVGGSPASVKHVATTTIAQGETITTSPLPYRFAATLNVPGPHTVTIEPGATLEFPAGATIRFYTSGALKPRLLAAGNETDAVVFRSSTGAPGSWEGLKFETTAAAPESIIRNATVHNARTAFLVTGWAPRLLLDNVSLDAPTVRGIDMLVGSLVEASRLNATATPSAIRCQSLSDLTLLNSGIESGAVGIELNNCGGSVITNTTFIGNPTYAVSASNSDIVDAEFNYWGHPTGPSGLGGGLGDAVVGNVDYDPWLEIPGSYNPLPDVEPPESLTATPGPGTADISLSWTAAPGDVFTYGVYRSTSPVIGFVNIANVTAPTTTYVDSGLTSAPTYYYRITSRNHANGEGTPSAVVGASLKGKPTAPEGLVATRDGANIVLDWRRPFWDGGFALDYYNVLQSTNQGSSYSPLATVPATQTTYQATACSPECYYQVTANNTVQDSGPSNEAAATAKFNAFPPESIRGTTPGAGHPLKEVFPCQEDVSGAINVVTGQLVASTCLFEADSPYGLDVLIQASHRSQSTTRSVLGPHWDLSLMRRVAIEDNGDAIFLDGTGRADRFTWDGTKFSSPPGFYQNLTKVGAEYEMSYPGGLIETYAASGQRVSIRDPVDNQIKFTHDSAGNLVQVIDSIGRRITFLHSDGLLQSIRDWAGRAVKFTYSADRELTSIELSKPVTASGPLHSFTYNADRNLLNATDPNGQTYLRNEYDSQSRVIRQVVGAGLYNLSYDPANKTTVVKDPNGNPTTWKYQALDTPLPVSKTVLSVRGPTIRTNLTTTYVSNANLEITKTTQPSGIAEEWVYDANNADPRARGNILESKQLPSDATKAPVKTSFTYENQYQKIKTVTSATGNDGAHDPLKHTTTFRYGYEEQNGDLNGDASNVSPPHLLVRIDHAVTFADGVPLPQHMLASSAAQLRSETFVYSDRGQLFKHTAANGTVTTYTYYGPGTQYPEGLLKSVKHSTTKEAPPGESNQQAFADADAVSPPPIDPVYLMLFVVAGLGAILVVTRRAPRPTKAAFLMLVVFLVPVCTPHGTVAAEPTLGNADGPFLMQAGGGPTSPAGSPTDYEYNFTYDESGNVASVNAPGNRTTNLTYDAFNRPIAIVAPGPAQLRMDIVYDLNGNVVSRNVTNAIQLLNGTYVVDPEHPSLQTEYEYDALDRVTKTISDAARPANAPAGDAVETLLEQLQYDLNGNLVLKQAHSALTGERPNMVESYVYNERDQLIATTKGGISPLFGSQGGNVGLNVTGVDEPFTLYLHSDAVDLPDATTITSLLPGAPTPPNTIATPSSYNMNQSPPTDPDAVSALSPGLQNGEFASTDPALSWTWESGSGPMNFNDARVALNFWVNGTPLATDKNNTWHLRLYNETGLVTSTEPGVGVVFPAEWLTGLHEYRIVVPPTSFTASTLRLVLEPGPAPVLRYVLVDSVDAPTRLEIGQTTTALTVYDPDGNPSTQVDENGRVTLIGRDDYGRSSNVTLPDGARLAAAYETGGLLKSLDRYGPLGGLGTNPDPNAPELLLERRFMHYDEAGRVWREDVALFDPATGNPLPDGPLTPGDGNATTLYEYDQDGRLVRQVNDNGFNRTFAYDGLGRSVLETDEVGNQVRYEYDVDGNIASQTRLEFVDGEYIAHRTVNQYDDLRRLIRTTDALGQTERYGYDGEGNLVWKTDALGPLITDPDDLYDGLINGNGNVVQYAYDGLGRLLSTNHTLTSSGNSTGSIVGYLVTAQDWDPEGRLARQVDAEGHETTYAYDDLGRLVSETYADGTSKSYEYDGVGNLVRWRDPNGNVVRQDFDAANRLVRRVLEEGLSQWSTIQTFEYDGLGRPTRSTDNNDPTTPADDSTVSATYDSAGRQLSEMQNGQTVMRDHDGLGNVLSLTYPNGRVVSKGYDALNRLLEVTDGAAELASFVYEGERLSSRSSGNGITTTFQYDGLLRPTSVLHDVAGTDVGYDYAYTRANQVVQETLVHAPTWSQHATYDSANRLVSVSRSNFEDLPLPSPVLSTQLSAASEWVLDGANNWDQFESTTGGVASTETRSHGPLNEILNVTKGTAVTEFLYDESGNRQSDGAFTYVWDAFNRLREVRDVATDAMVATYTYDAAGRRISKVADSETITYTYDGTVVLEERDAAGMLLRQYVHGADGPVLFDRNLDGDAVATGSLDHRLYYHEDMMGSVVALTNATGVVLEGYLYDVYGQRAVVTPGANGTLDWGADDVAQDESLLDNAYGFTGQRFDDETGLYHFQARYYDPVHGVFISRDPIGIWGDPHNLGNAYAYAGNDPLNVLDPTGMWGLKKLGKYAKDFGTAVAAFVPIKQTDWAREEVKQTFQNFHQTRTDIPKIVHVIADVLAPPQSKTEAALMLGFSAIPGGKWGLSGGKLGMAAAKAGNLGKVATKLDRPIVIIGENMERVKKYANAVRGEVFEGTGMAANKAWVALKKKQGYLVHDIGPDFARRAERLADGKVPFGPFYPMERKSLVGYDGYMKVFERHGKLKGGVFGLDF